MASPFVDPDEMVRFEVQVFEGSESVGTKRFSTLEAAEAYAEAVTDEVPGRRAVIEDVEHLHVFEEEVQADTALAEDYPRLG